MKFKQLFKNKRTKNIIIIYILIVIIAGNVSDEKKESNSLQSDCNIVNTEYSADFNGWNNNMGMDVGLLPEPDQSDIDLCLGTQSTGATEACYVALKIDDSGWGYDDFACVACAPAGFHVTTSEACCSNVAISSVYHGYDFVCKGSEPQPGSECNSELQSSIASILGNVDFAAGWDCKTRFYIVAFGGGLVTVLLILASL